MEAGLASCRLRGRSKTSRGVREQGGGSVAASWVALAQVLIHFRRGRLIRDPLTRQPLTLEGDLDIHGTVTVCFHPVGPGVDQAVKQQCVQGTCREQTGP